MMKILTIILLISLVMACGCTTTNTTQPVQTMNTLPAQIPNDTEEIAVSPAFVVVAEENMTSVKGDIISQIKFNESNVDIINCGTKAYGSLVVDEVKSILRDSNYTLRYLVITNASDQYVGGCEKVVQELTEIKQVWIMTNDTSDYITQAIRWIPSNRVIYNG